MSVTGLQVLGLIIADSFRSAIDKLFLASFKEQFGIHSTMSVTGLQVLGLIIADSFRSAIDKLFLASFKEQFGIHSTMSVTGLQVLGLIIADSFRLKWKKRSHIQNAASHTCEDGLV